MSKPAELVLPSDQYPQVQEAVQQMQLGDGGTWEIKFTLKEKTADATVFTVEAIIPEGYEMPKDTDDNGPQVNSPPDSMMTPAAMMVRKRQGNP